MSWCLVTKVNNMNQLVIDFLSLHKASRGEQPVPSTLNPTADHAGFELESLPRISINDHHQNKDMKKQINPDIHQFESIAIVISCCCCVCP